MCSFRCINLNELSPEKRNNVIRHSVKKDKESRITVAESELLRILKHLEGKDIEESELDSIISLKVGKNVKKYDYLIRKNGVLKLIQHECKYDNAGKITHRQDKQVDKYKSMITGAGHSRNCKSYFIRTDIVRKLDEILRCGIPLIKKYNRKKHRYQYTTYARPAKWNAYYAMCSTDSVPIKRLPNIIVVDDYEKIINECVDEVEECAVDKKKKYYKVHNNVKRDIRIKPFDGAGIVTPQCAARWALELNIRNGMGKRYIPAAFQFRAIPGIKGELFVADLYGFANEHNCYQIRDIWGKVWDIRDETVDCIMTKSQFKFYDMYKSFDHWKCEFIKELYGYRRTFNISSYSEHPDDLKKTTMLSYQPLQTLSFTKDEIARLTKPGIDLYTNIVTDLDEFLKYRGITEPIDTENNQFVPSYYQALQKNHALFNDKYVYGKIEDDVVRLKNDLLAGKIITEGNYQTLSIDVVGLMEYALGLPVKGLLEAEQIYSSYWNNKTVKVVDIIRNPHIYMEHRIGYLINTDAMKKWYKYQTTGIITSMYDTYLLALGGADTDGDHVCTVSNKDIINAVKRELDAGHGRTIYFNKLETNKKKGVRINNTRGLMRVNQKSFSNDIGSVVNEISKLWSNAKVDENGRAAISDEIRDAIKVCSCIGALVIDFAKTGEKAEIPAEIKRLLNGVKKPYFMRYLPQNLELAQKENNTIHKAYATYNRELEEIKELYSFDRNYDSNINQICTYMELELGSVRNLRIQENKEFDWTTLLYSDVAINRKVNKLVKSLQQAYENIATEKNTENFSGKDLEQEYKSRYRYFWNYCKSALCSFNIATNDLVDMLIKIFYTDKKFVSDTKQKDILWNVFGEELVKRCDNDFTIDEEKMDALRQRRKKNYELYRKEVVKKQKTIRANIDILEAYSKNVLIFTKGDRDFINDAIKNNERIKSTNAIDACKLYAVLLMLQRKTDSDEVIKHYNKPNSVTDLSLSKLAGIDRRKIDVLLSWMEQENLLEIKLDKNVKCKIRINDSLKAGDIWIREENYHVICRKIRDYFRK